MLKMTKNGLPFPWFVWLLLFIGVFGPVLIFKREMVDLVPLLIDEEFKQECKTQSSGCIAILRNGSVGIASHFKKTWLTSESIFVNGAGDMVLYFKGDIVQRIVYPDDPDYIEYAHKDSILKDRILRQGFNANHND